jgi:methylglutaconyl-CoA hydratase
VSYAVADGVATISLARPDSRNVLDAESMALLKAHLASAADDNAVRVVVLTGEGRAFCAGADLRGASAGEAESFAAAGPQALVDVLSAMLDHPKPIIARVQGHVAGGGNGLVAAADLSVAVENATFAFSEVRVGVAPAVISVVTLRRMNPAHAAELLLTGERVSAQRAYEAGLVNAVVSDEGLDGHVQRWVSQLLLGGPEAIARTKEVLRRVPALARDEAFAYTAELSAALFSSAEAAAGMTAFLQKRPAPWVPTD